jgi:DNA mismatch repair protein MutS
VALLDVLCGLAEVADSHGYTRPLVDDSWCIEIEQGRHPVVERYLPSGEFVPDDVSTDRDGDTMLIVTGPNMAGKSTTIRQVALITLMAQMGSFVPCRRARVGIVDRLFTRVGAGDNLARGESTFMVEMREVATILRYATSRSLLVLDEIGRGTSTYDGISIAWAVAEYVHDRVQARTLFATHYHELCQLAEVKPRVRNYSIGVREWRGNVIFLHKIAPGISSRSYGIEVARLAGLPKVVIERARAVLSALEGEAVVEDLPLGGRTHRAETSQIDLFDEAPTAAREAAGSAVERELAGIQVDRLTPLEALNILSGLVDRATAARRGE